MTTAQKLGGGKRGAEDLARCQTGCEIPVPTSAPSELGAAACRGPSRQGRIAASGVPLFHHYTFQPRSRQTACARLNLVEQEGSVCLIALDSYVPLRFCPCHQCSPLRWPLRLTRPRRLHWNPPITAGTSQSRRHLWTRRRRIHHTCSGEWPPPSCIRALSDLPRVRKAVKGACCACAV
jgi:hypothetical protein